MRKEYKRLGDFIQRVDVRNAENLDIPLMGLSIQKCFIPSIANTIGTDMKRYKVIERNQFAYGPVTSRNGDKITIALFEDYDKALISQAYIPFEIHDKEGLLPKYLMMWFSRPEFDRYARFRSHGSARETFDWDEMCDVELPIPSIEKQREIVADYQAVENKIKANEAICEKLEETAQTIYRRWFEEFEFPNEEEKPYKSSGGKMVWNEELEKEIPEGWEVKMIKEISKEVITGKTPSTIKTENFGDFIPFITIPDMHNKVFVNTTERSLSKIGLQSQLNKTLPPKTICVSCIGTAGLVSLTMEKSQTNQQINSILLSNNNEVYYYFLTLRKFSKKIIEWGSRGSVGVNMNKSLFEEIRVLVPNKKIVHFFHQKVNYFFEMIKSKMIETQEFQQLQSLLLTRMTRGG